jgi:hypothetical protein
VIGSTPPSNHLDRGQDRNRAQRAVPRLAVVDKRRGRVATTIAASTVRHRERRRVGACICEGAGGVSAEERGPVRPAAAARPRRGSILLTAGVLLIALGVIFRVAIVPSLLKIPTNLDKTAHFAGRQLAYVDPKSGAPLPAPQRPPLTITRHITADKNASDSNRVVLDESVTAEVKGLPPLRQDDRYVMDRKSGVNVADSRSFAFVPANKVDRSGAYRLAFGFDVAEGKPIKLYSNDTNSTYQAVPDPRKRAGDVEGTRALNPRPGQGNQFFVSNWEHHSTGDAVVLPRLARRQRGPLHSERAGRSACVESGRSLRPLVRLRRRWERFALVRGWRPSCRGG